MSTQSRETGAPTAPPNVAFRRPVMKIGFDGSSLPRLVVVTDTTLYVCLLSGGITRSVDIKKVEYLSISTTGDGNEHDEEVEGLTNDIHADDATSPRSVLSSTSKRSGSSGGGGGGATPEKIAERIRRRFQRKKTRESAVKARQPASAQAVPEAETSMIIATLGVEGEVALVLRFHNDDDAVMFADAMEHVAEESQTPIRFHLPAHISARTSPARSVSASPTRRTTHAAENGAADQATVDAPPAEATRQKEAKVTGEIDETTGPAPAESAVPSSSTADGRVRRWRDRSNAAAVDSEPVAAPAPSSAVLPPRSYFSTAPFGPRPGEGPTTVRRDDPGDARDPDAASEPSEDRPGTPSGGSSAAASLPTSSNSTSAPPSPVPAHRADGRVAPSTADLSASHAAVINAALNAARRSQDARREDSVPAPVDNAAILEPLVHSATEASGGTARQKEDAEPRIVHELELSPDASRARRSSRLPAPVVPKVVSSDSETADDAEQQDVHTSLYHQLYPADGVPRSASRDRGTRHDKGVRAVHDEPARDEGEATSGPQRSLPPPPPPRPSGLNDSHHSRQKPSSRERHQDATETSAAERNSVPHVGTGAFRGPPSAYEVSRLLRIDEGLAEEMLTAREEARAAQAACDEAQRRLRDRDDELRALRRSMEVMQHQHSDAIAHQAQAHHTELREVQEAFDAYDVRMNTFLDKMQSDHEADAAQWLAERRELKALLKAKDTELERLTLLLTAATAGDKSRAPQPQQPASAPLQTQEANGVAAGVRRTPAAAPTHPTRAGSSMAFLDAGRGQLGVDDRATLMAVVPADYYEEAHDRLQSRLAKYTGHAHTSLPVRQRKGGVDGAWEAYDADEVVGAAALSVPSSQYSRARPPQRILRTPLVPTPSSHAHPPPVSAQRAITRHLQYPDDDEEGEPVRARGEGRAQRPLPSTSSAADSHHQRQPRRLLSPARE